jgi:prepilin signal peptidase PulO-like enzyme (type II secretory pathway)
VTLPLKLSDFDAPTRIASARTGPASMQGGTGGSLETGFFHYSHGYERFLKHGQQNEPIKTSYIPMRCRKFFPESKQTIPVPPTRREAMEYLITAVLFVFGLVFGSFFNVVGLRVPQGESIVQPPSHCKSCDTRLRPLDLIPVLSYLLNRGACRYCRTKVSLLYPVMESICGISFALVYLTYGWSAEMFMGLLFVSLLVIVSVADLAYRLIPDKVTLPALALFLILRLLVHPTQPYWMHLIAMAVGFGLFFLLTVLSRGGVGGGDIKLFAVVGLFLGLPLLALSIFLSALLGTLFGIILMLFRGAVRKTQVPFGPFIAAGSLLAYLKGDAIIGWYVDVFF